MAEGKRTSWVVAFRRNGIYSEIEYQSTYAYTAQEAAEIARYEWNVYEVCEVYKLVKNWN